MPPPVTPRPSKPARTRNPGQDPPRPPTPSPTSERLRDPHATRMRMSHVDQPLMLMERLGRRSPAPAQDVARRILGEDVTQIDYYSKRVKRMVGKVHLQRHHPYEQGAYDLVGGEELSDAERDQLLELCRQRLDAFRMQRGEEVGRLLTQKPADSATAAAIARRSAAREHLVLTRAHAAPGCCQTTPLV